MELLRKFIKKTFRKKLSEYVYLFYFNLPKNLMRKKYLCFEYFQDDTRDIIRDRVLNILSIDDNFEEYKIYIKRNNESKEYNDESTINLEKYDVLVIEVLR